MSTKNPCDNDNIKLCVICGDKANGLHYRVLSCEGCKTFFRRNVRHRDRLKCEMDKQGRCEMDLYTRRQCPACRMKKCLDSGMQVTRVWTKDRLATRKPITKKVKVESPSLPPTTVLSITPSSSPVSSPCMSLSMTSPSQTSVTSTSASLMSEENSPESHCKLHLTDQQKDFIDYIVMAFDQARQKISAPSIPEERDSEVETDVTETKIRVEGDKGMKMAKKKTGYEGQRSEAKDQDMSETKGLCDTCAVTKSHDGGNDSMFTHFMEMLIVILKQLIAMAKCIPGFTEMSYQDQAILIKTSLIENMMLGSSEHYVPDKGGFKNVDTNEIYGEKECERAGFGQIRERMIMFSQEMSELKLNHSEYCLLYAMVILSPDRDSLQNRSKVEDLQQPFVESLLSCTRFYHPDDKILFAKIVSKLTQLRSFSEQYTEHILSLQLNGKQLVPLLAELFDTS